MDSFGSEISEANAFGIIQKLFEEEIITENEGNLMLSAVSKNVLGISQIENRLRARILHGFWNV